MPHAALRRIRDEHSALAAVLRALRQMLREGPGDQPERFFDVVRAMLFYIDEFPERSHHPLESNLLFPKLARADAGLMPVIRQLEADHMHGEGRVRELQHLLLGWELAGEGRRPAFEQQAQAYVDFYLAHMRLEEDKLLPAAERLLTRADWAQLDAAWSHCGDPLAGGEAEAGYDRLFARIVRSAPAPVGLGAPLRHARPPTSPAVN
jgi:hemerythrin-like domain-containing protein